MTTPMIDRLKERIAELEMQNTQLQTLFAAAIAVWPGHEGGSTALPLTIPFDRVRQMSGRTVTSDPDHVAEVVRVTIDPVDLPDFGGDMQGLLAREDRH